MHVLVLLLHVEVLGLLQDGADTGLGEVFDEGVVLGQAAVGAEQLLGALVLGLGVGVLVDAFLGVGEYLRHQQALGIVELLDGGLETVELLLVVILAGGAADDEGGTGVVNEHRVHLVDDGVVVAALHQLFGVAAHVVAQVVKAELVVGAVGDVAVVGGFALGAVGLVLVDAVDRQAVELKEHTHPLGVTLGQVVVDGDHMHTLAGQGVEVDGQGGHEGLTLTGGHLGDLAAVQHHTADNLHVVVHHVPGNLVAAGHPMVLIDGFVALDGDAGVGGRQVAVVVGGGDGHRLVGGEAAGGLFHHGVGFGQYLVQHLLGLVIAVLLQLVDALVEALLLVDGHVVFLVDTLAQGGQLGLLGLDGTGYLLLEFDGFGTQAVIVEGLDSGVDGKGGVEERLDNLQVALALVAEQFGQNISHVPIMVFSYLYYL